MSTSQRINNKRVNSTMITAPVNTFQQYFSSKESKLVHLGDNDHLHISEIAKIFGIHQEKIRQMLGERLGQKRMWVLDKTISMCKTSRYSKNILRISAAKMSKYAQSSAKWVTNSWNLFEQLKLIKIDRSAGCIPSITVNMRAIAEYIFGKELVSKFFTTWEVTSDAYIEESTPLKQNKEVLKEISSKHIEKSQNENFQEPVANATETEQKPTTQAKTMQESLEDSLELIKRDVRSDNYYPCSDAENRLSRHDDHQTQEFEGKILESERVLKIHREKFFDRTAPIEQMLSDCKEYYSKLNIPVTENRFVDWLYSETVDKTHPDGRQKYPKIYRRKEAISEPVTISGTFRAFIAPVVDAISSHDAVAAMRRKLGMQKHV